MRTRFPLLVISVFGAGCATGDDRDVICTQSMEAAVVVAVEDAMDGTPIAAGARGVVRDGNYSSPLVAASVDAEGRLIELKAAEERPGTYSVEVEREDYLPWRRDGVRVLRNACHVETQRLVAKLQRAG